MNSVDKSKHIEGKAIDLYIIDIDGRNGYNQNDYNLIKQAAAKVNQSNPALSGRIFFYLDKGFFSRRMVHVELD